MHKGKADQGDSGDKQAIGQTCSPGSVLRSPKPREAATQRLRPELARATLNSANSRSRKGSLIAGQQQKERTNRENCESGNKWAGDEYSCQSAKIIRGGRASIIDTKYHSKEVTRRPTHEHNRSINRRRYSAPRSSETMLPIKKDRAGQCENRRQKRK
jgi:hypothetical protein